MSRKWPLVTAVILLVLLGPVLLRQLFPPERRHYDYVRLADTQYTETSFRNSEQELQLGGMLFIPEGEGPFPAAVIIHGSGTSRRDSGWYLTLTQYLQDNGIAVLLPDKRGSEQSEGNWRTADFEDLATDTLAAIDYLRQQNLVPVSSIGLIGMSQGGWIAPIVANQTGQLAFVVNMVGSAVTPNEQLLFEENYNIQQMGFLPGVSYVFALMSSAHIRHVRRPDFYSRVGDYDPIPLWDELAVPALVLYGRDDTNVPSDESARRLESLGKPAIEVIVYDGSGHALQEPEDRGDGLIREEALEAMRDFIRD